MSSCSLHWGHAYEISVYDIHGLDKHGCARHVDSLPPTEDDVDLRDLEAFLAVVMHDGFRPAADALYVSQPSLTRRVKRLEDDLGVPLLDRGPWGIRLTGHGETLQIGARRLLDTVDEVRANTVGTWNHTFVLGAAATASGSYLAEFLSNWIPQHRDVRMTMIEDGAKRLRQRLWDRQCDVALLAAPIPRQFEALPITRVRVQAVPPPGHPLAGASGPLSVDELDCEDLLVNPPSFLSSELLRSACRIRGIQPEVVYESSVGQTLAALAEAGLGTAIMSDNVDLRGFDLPFRILMNGQGRSLKFDLYISWVRERRLPPILLDFARDLSAFTRPLRNGL